MEVVVQRDCLIAAYDGVVCDLDGVVYRGGAAVTGAPAALQQLAARGVGITYATNNASRPPTEVAAQLAALGAPAQAGDIVSSAQAGAERLRAELDEGALVLALGGPGVRLALDGVGLRAADPGDPAALAAVAVLQGFGRQLTVADFEVAVRVLGTGARWVGTNGDTTLPLEWGTAPGNGAYLDLLATATGRQPDVVGKPGAPLYELALSSLATARRRTLAIGDRISTDIAGAAAAGLDSAWVLTGVDRPSDLFGGPRQPVATYVIDTLAGLTVPYAAARADDGGWVCDRARATLSHGKLVLDPRDAPVIATVRAGLAALVAARDDGHDLDELARLARPLDALLP